ncbi:MAG: polysaccharide export protein [Cyanobacteria bacterium NC_groundwater_1444_Ag_S-0.65um_54_12]|nr:polysaccharide export protein [Cyanobacteria bacterium NC_groundwater_1444_Ag_S-0.65um_54_12]
MKRLFSMNRNATAILTCGLLCAALSPAALATEYRLRPGDAVNITILGHPELSVLAQAIRPDGQLTIPLIQEANLAGKTISDATAYLGKAFLPFLHKPDVTLNIARFRPLRIAVLGQVTRPGIFEFDAPPRLSDALAVAGGLTERASRQEIKVLEHAKSNQKYDFDQLLSGRLNMPEIPDGATIEVNEVWYPDFYRVVPIVASVLTAGALLLR